MTQRKIQPEQLDLGAIGDVNGPASSTDNAIPRFDGTTGKTLQGSGITINDSNTLSLPEGSIISYTDELDVLANGTLWLEGSADVQLQASFGDVTVYGNNVNLTGATNTVNSVPIVTTTATQTLTNKRVTPRVYSTASVSAISPASDSYDVTHITALSVGLAMANPTGTPTDGQRHIIRIKDNGTSRAISWTSGYRAVGVALPTSTTASKTLYVGAIYNSTDSKWDVVMVNQEV